MFRDSISQKFILYLMGISLIPLVIVGIVSSRISSKILQDEASLYTREIVSNQRDYLDLLLRQIESLIANISSVEEIRMAVENTEDTETTFTDLTTRAEIGYILNGYSNIDGLVSIDIFTLGGAQYHVGDTLNTDNIREDIREDVFALALENDQWVTWIGIEDNVNANSSYEKVVTAARVLYRVNRETLQQEPVALILVNYSPESLYEHFSTVNFGDDAYMLMLDSHGHYIYHPDLALAGESADAGLLNTFAEVNDSAVVLINGVKMSVSITQSAVSDWTVVSLVPLATLNAKALPIQRAIIIVLFICFMAIALIAWLYNRGVVFPIRDITRKYQMIKQNPLSSQNYHVTVKGNDEIAELGHWFNTFVDILATKARNEEVLLENLMVARILYETSNQIIAVKHLPSILKLVANNFVQALSADRVAVILFDIATRKIEYFHKAGAGSDQIVTIDFDELEEGLSGWVLLNNQGTLSSKDKPDPRESPTVQKRRQEANAGSIMVAPLSYRGRIRGTVTVMNRLQDPDFTEKDLELMMALANQSIISIENSRLIQSLQESEEKFSKAFRASPDPMTITSVRDRRYMDVNQSFLTVRNYQRHDVIGRTPDDLGVWSDKSKEAAFLQLLEEDGRVHNFELKIPLAPGHSNKERVVLLSAEIIEFAGEACMLTVAKDITELRQLEQQRIRFAIERERVQILSDFITEASHEFRTPLAIINTNTYLLKKAVTSEKHQGKLGIISEQVKIISSLVDSLTLMTKIDGGGHDFQNTLLDINEIVYAIYQVIQVNSQEKPIEFVLNISKTPLMFEGDEEFLSLVVQNCLENALHFTNEGEVHVRTMTRDNMILIEIQDTGIGIAEDELERVFERFYQADKAGTFRGFGLGLPIAKSIVEHYGGHIKVRSEPGTGSTFTIYLPLMSPVLS